MTKHAALHQFFNEFGIPFYPSSNVPENKTFPWGTYDATIGAWEDGECSITVNLWYRTESEAIPNKKAQEISKTIGLGGKIIRCDGGAIWLKRGSPFSQPITDETDPMIKRRYINVSAEFLTQD